MLQKTDHRYLSKQKSYNTGCILLDHGQIYDQFTTNLQPIYASIYDLFCARAMRGCQLTPTRERPILIDSESTEHHSGNTLATEIINVRASTTVAQKHLYYHYHEQIKI